LAENLSMPQVHVEFSANPADYINLLVRALFQLEVVLPPAGYGAETCDIDLSPVL